jgi:hypothetical protein
LRWLFGALVKGFPLNLTSPLLFIIRRRPRSRQFLVGISICRHVSPQGPLRKPLCCHQRNQNFHTVATIGDLASERKETQDDDLHSSPSI